MTNLPQGVLYPSLIGARSTNYLPGVAPAFAQGYSLQHGLGDYPLTLADGAVTRRGETVVDPELALLRVEAQKRVEAFEKEEQEGKNVYMHGGVARYGPGFPSFWRMTNSTGKEPETKSTDPLVVNLALKAGPPGWVLTDGESEPSGGSIGAIGAQIGKLAAGSAGTLAKGALAGLKGLFSGGAKSAAKALASKGVEVAKTAAIGIGKQGASAAKAAATELGKEAGASLLAKGQEKFKGLINSKVQNAVNRLPIDEATKRRLEVDLAAKVSSGVEASPDLLKKLGSAGKQAVAAAVAKPKRPKKRRVPEVAPVTRGGSIVPQNLKLLKRLKPRRSGKRKQKAADSTRTQLFAY